MLGSDVQLTINSTNNCEVHSLKSTSFARHLGVSIHPSLKANVYKENKVTGEIFRVCYSKALNTL